MKRTLSFIGMIVFTCHVTWAAEVSFHGLGDLSGSLFMSEAHDVSADGSVVVGISLSTSGREAFRWTASGGMVGLGDLPGGSIQSEAYAVSNDGSVVVGRSNADWGRKAFRWTSGSGMVSLTETLSPYQSSTAYGVSDDGSVIVGDFGVHAFRWTAETGAVNISSPGSGYLKGVSANGNVVFGNYATYNSGTSAYRWTVNDSWEKLDFGWVSAASPDGSVFVGANDNQLIRWTAADGIVPLGNLPDHTTNYPSEAAAISADGSIVVGYDCAHESLEAFIWDGDHGMRNLQSVLTNEYNLNLTGWQLTHATSISADGQTLVGIGYNPSGQSEAWIATIPEPATLLLLALGSMMLRRQK